MRDGSLELIQLCLERVRRCTSLTAEGDYRPADLLKLRRYCARDVSTPPLGRGSSAGRLSSRHRRGRPHARRNGGHCGMPRCRLPARHVAL